MNVLHERPLIFLRVVNVRYERPSVFPEKIKSSEKIKNFPGIVILQNHTIPV
jgi:hypothetical protein